MTSKTTNKFSPEVRTRAVRMVLDHAGEHPSRWAAVTSIAAKIGCTPQTLHDWVKKAEVNSGQRAGVPTDMADKLKALERENRELRQTNEILRKASAYFATAELDRRYKPRSRSSTIIVGRMGSSRSARFCRSPPRPTTPMWPSGTIPPSCRPAPSRTPR
jgi:transposase